MSFLRRNGREPPPPPPSVHKVFGESVPDSPDLKEVCGESGTDPPISPDSEEKKKILSEEEKAQDRALNLLIEHRRAQMPRDPLGISDIGTESANCELSREFKTLQTVDSQQCESAGNAEPSGEPPPPHNSGPSVGRSEIHLVRW